MTGQDKLSLKCPRTAQGDLSRVCQHKDFVSILCHMKIGQKSTIITKRCYHYHLALWYLYCIYGWGVISCVKESPSQGPILQGQFQLLSSVKRLGHNFRQKNGGFHLFEIQVDYSGWIRGCLDPTTILMWEFSLGTLFQTMGDDQLCSTPRFEVIQGQTFHFGCYRASLVRDHIW